MNTEATRSALWERLEEARLAYRAGSSDKGLQLHALKKVLDNQSEMVRIFSERYPPNDLMESYVTEFQALSYKAQEYLDAGPIGQVAPLPDLAEAYIAPGHYEPTMKPRPLDLPLKSSQPFWRGDLTLVTEFGPGDGIWEVGIKVVDEKGLPYYSTTSGDLELPKPNPAHNDRVMHWKFEVTFREFGTHHVIFYLAGQEFGRFPISLEGTRQG